MRLAIVGYAIGMSVNALSTYGMFTSNFDMMASIFWNAPDQIGRVAVAPGHASVLILLVKGARLRWLDRSVSGRGADGVL